MLGSCCCLFIQRHTERDAQHLFYSSLKWCKKSLTHSLLLQTLLPYKNIFHGRMMLWKGLINGSIVNVLIEKVTLCPHSQNVRIPTFYLSLGVVLLFVIVEPLFSSPYNDISTSLVAQEDVQIVRCNTQNLSGLSNGRNCHSFNFHYSLIDCLFP